MIIALCGLVMGSDAQWKRKLTLRDFGHEIIKRIFT